MIYNVNNYYFMFMIRVSQRLVVTILIMYNINYVYYCSLILLLVEKNDINSQNNYYKS